MPIYRFDPTSRIHWLEFDGKPEQETIDLLKHNGWRWSGYRKQWHTNRRFAKPPVGIEYEDGGECDYSTERPDRLASAAERAVVRSEEAYERSNAMVEGIPLGQPIITGTHSGKQMERTLEQSRRAMSVSTEEQEKADWLAQKARSSARHQAYKERPDVIARRIKRLKGEIASIRNSMKHEPYDLWRVRQDGTPEQIADMERRVALGREGQEAKIRLLEQEIADNEQALQEAGGLIADREVIEVGDVIKGGWRGLCEVKKINIRKGEVLSYTCLPLEKTWCSKYVIPKDEVYGVAIRQGNVSSVALLEVQLQEMQAHSPAVMPPVSEPVKRAFAVEHVETIDVAASNPTSIFPTPHHVADQLAQELPHDAYLILEPSAGTGSLANAATRLLFERGQNHAIHCCEIVPQLRRSLEERGYQMVADNFLDYRPDFQYDAILANPPFANTEWLTHIEHMLDLLKPGGTLTAIVPSGFAFRQDRRIVALRTLVEEHGYWQELPHDAFVQSGTNASTILFSVQKPALCHEPLQQVTLW